LQHRPAAAVLNDFLEQAWPTLRAVEAALSAASTTTSKEIEAFNASIAMAEQVQADLMALLESLAAPARAHQPPSSNTGVTFQLPSKNQG
jgi:hypothetical protein